MHTCPHCGSEMLAWQQGDHQCAEGLAELMKTGIRADIAAGTIPAAVGSFAALHDYVDANLYGGLDDDVRWDLSSNEVMDLINEATAIVDRWLATGGDR